jgi:plastocyanin
MSCTRSALVLVSVALLASATAAQTTHPVSTSGTQFSPKHLTITGGDSVTWTWTGGNLHTATEGTDTSIDPTDAFSYIVDQWTPSWTHLFDTKFLFENPRPGHFYPYLCVPHALFGMSGSITVQSPWSNRGFAKGGSLGEPLLYGDGPLTVGSSAQVLMENGPALAPAALFVGLVEGGVPFKGGTLVPVPLLLQLDLVTDASGEIALPFTTPPGVSGLAIYLQCAMADATATKGVGLSNAAEALFQ